MPTVSEFTRGRGSLAWLLRSEMGAASSVKRSHESMKSEIERLRKRELDREEEMERERSDEKMGADARIAKLQSERHELTEQLRQKASLLQEQSEGWQKEKSKTLALMFSDLPLSLLSRSSSDVVSGEPSLSRRFPMVTIAQCDVVGFAALTTRLQPQEATKMVDHLHRIIDEVYTHHDIFIMERTSEGCTAASGLEETTEEDRTRSVLSLTDSSYGSELDFDLEDPEHWAKPRQKKEGRKERSGPSAQQMRTASHFAALLATASLQLMSSSSRVAVPRSDRPLQLRLALHSGPCSGGVIGLQTTAGTARIPHYKLFGPTLRYTSLLCSSGLALQVRISKQCHSLLEKAGGFQFERCPDYAMVTSGKSVESYWLVGKEGLSARLPSLDQALSLSEYEDIEF